MSTTEAPYTEFASFANPLYSPWLSDPEFLEIDSKYPETHKEGFFREGRYIQYHLARHAAQLETDGDFIECGVYKGKSVDIFASVVEKFSNRFREVWGFDSFQGLDQPNEEDIDIRSNTQFFSKGRVRGWDKKMIETQLVHHPHPIHLIEGWIPQCFEGYEDKKFVFAHIDVDLYQATYDSLCFIYPRMGSGGILLFDDYGFPMCAGARKAVDNYFAEKKEKPIPVPSGQAFVIKY